MLMKMRFSAISDKVSEFVLKTLHLTRKMVWKRSKALFPRAKEFRFSLALVCIALMFFATMAQALDSHELGMVRASHPTAATTSAGSLPGFCLVCVAAHSPSVIAQANFIHFVARSYVNNKPLATNFVSLLTIFDLSVRPPPVA